MIARQVALVPESANISVDVREIARVAAAIQKQATRDFRPIWEVMATVDGFGTLEDVPLGYWPVILVEDLPNAAGVHLDRLGQPYALIEVGDSWSLTASHETLAMLADPSGNRLVAGNSPVQSQGRVEFLVEVCDPPEDESSAYTVNSVLVSDFYTPRYFDSVTASGVQYSFSGAITKPRQVLRGGYLSWHNPPDDHWYQLRFFGSSPQVQDLGVLNRDGRSLREIVDSLTPQTKRLSALTPDDEALRTALTAADESREGSRLRAEELRKQIGDLAQKRPAADASEGGRQRAEALRAEIDTATHGSGTRAGAPPSPREFTDAAAAKAAADRAAGPGSGKN